MDPDQTRTGQTEVSSRRCRSGRVTPLAGREPLAYVNFPFLRCPRDGLVDQSGPIVPQKDSCRIFPSETGLTPARPENVWRRWIGPRLEKIGLGGVNFQVLRRTHASLGHAAGIDPKVRADQMGNGIGVNLDEYTVTGLDQRTAAVELLEASILQ